MTAVAEAEPPSILTAVGWAVLYLATGFALMIVLTTVGMLATGGLSLDPFSTRPLILQTIAGLLSYGFMTWAIGMKALRLSLGDLRWMPLAGAGRGFRLGLALGALPALLAVGLAVVLGGARFLPDSGGLGGYLAQMLRIGLILLPAALLEEVMFRGVGQVVLARAVGRLPAVVMLSVAFALAHLRNPNGTSFAMVNIACAGILLGVAFYVPGGIWTAWGAHLGWNATLVAFDAPVSGLTFQIPFINYSPGGPAWLTGGPFGPEGGLLATVAISLATVAAWRWSEKEAT